MSGLLFETKPKAVVARTGGALESESVRRSGARGPQAASFLQFKLSVSSPSDPLEQEADRVADQVLGESAAMPSVSPAREDKAQRVCAECEEEEEPMGGGTYQAKAHTGGGDSAPGADASHGVNSLVRDGGSPLAPSVRRFFEPRFGVDFGDVRVHSGSRAATAAEALRARAFTFGSNIAFNTGEASAGPDGMKLLAHELTHVVQQRGGSRK